MQGQPSAGIWQIEWGEGVMMTDASRGLLYWGGEERGEREDVGGG